MFSFFFLFVDALDFWSYGLRFVFLCCLFVSMEPQSTTLPGQTTWNPTAVIRDPLSPARSSTPRAQHQLDSDASRITPTGMPVGMAWLANEPTTARWLASWWHFIIVQYMSSSYASSIPPDIPLLMYHAHRFIHYHRTIHTVRGDQHYVALCFA